MTERGNTERRIKNSLLDSKKEGVQYDRGQRSANHYEVVTECQGHEYVLKKRKSLQGASVRVERSQLSKTLDVL